VQELFKKAQWFRHKLLNNTTVCVSGVTLSPERTGESAFRLQGYQAPSISLCTLLNNVLLHTIEKASRSVSRRHLCWSCRTG
jgi:hypothetical protein